MRRLIIDVSIDFNCEAPESGCDGWSVIMDDQIISYPDIGLRRKLQVGLAFWIDNDNYRIRDNDYHRCVLVVWTGKPKDISARIYAERKADCERFLEEYSKWANGETFFVAIEDLSGNTIDAVGGYIGQEDVEYCLKEHMLEPGDVVRMHQNSVLEAGSITLPPGVEWEDDFFLMVNDEYNKALDDNTFAIIASSTLLDSTDKHIQALALADRAEELGLQRLAGNYRWDIANPCNTEVKT